MPEPRRPETCRDLPRLRSSKLKRGRRPEPLPRPRLEPSALGESRSGRCLPGARRLSQRPVSPVSLPPGAISCRLELLESLRGTYRAFFRGSRKGSTPAMQRATRKLSGGPGTWGRWTPGCGSFRQKIAQAPRKLRWLLQNCLCCLLV